MCGLSGFWQPAGFEASVGRQLAVKMADCLAHRGPDDAGVWVDQQVGVALSHRRLAVLDLSPAGKQPMVSESGRFILVFNGEIYNQNELRRELGRNAWRGHSDTETLLVALESWGVEAALEKCVGMFAVVLWDREERLLHLARDRMGEKPLYYGWQGGVFLFASELKAMKDHPAFENRIDRQALALFLRHNYIPAPWSIYQGIRKLLPGTHLVVEADIGSGAAEAPRPYWSLRSAAEQGQKNLFEGNETEALEELERLLTRSVNGQTVADVPLGAFLSGGVDSSTVVALMQANAGGHPVRTFTMGFEGEGYDEAQQAREVAKYLGTDHTELYVTAEEAMAVIPRLPFLYDEPFADSSQIPTFLVAQLARRRVTVALSGDGGDELFGGYNRYFWGVSIWRRVGTLPVPLRSALASILTVFPPRAWNAVFGILGTFLPPQWRYANPGDKLHKLAEILPAKTRNDLYQALVSFWKEPQTLVSGGRDLSCPSLSALAAPPELPDFAHRMMCLDFLSYLPDDILVKVDRAAMGVSLETRIPFLDHRLVEFAWRLPLAMKIRDGQGKWLLRQLLYRHVPKDLVERPKMGFAIPLDAWLRGPLREWAEELLAEECLRREGLFNPLPIHRKWGEHLSGKRNWAYHLWGVLMCQAWLEANRGTR
ncbi:MAG: asparagine synthase (glutamine-hydrolyzing) [Thermodesulfobacteriota bacterium]